MRASGDFGVPESGALLLLLNLGGTLKGGSRVLERLPRSLLARQMFLLSVLLGGAAVRVRGPIVQFRGTLVILVMRSIVITRRHIKVSRSARIWRGLAWQVRRRGRNIRGPVRYASFR